MLLIIESLVVKVPDLLKKASSISPISGRTIGLSTLMPTCSSLRFIFPLRVGVLSGSVISRVEIVIRRLSESKQFGLASCC